MHPGGNKNPTAPLWLLALQSTLVTSNLGATCYKARERSAGGPKQKEVERTAQANIRIQVCGMGLRPAMVPITREKGRNLLLAL